MGYLFLLIALLVGATKGFCGKKVSGFATETADATLSNFLRMLICVVIGAVIAVAQGGIQSLAVDKGLILVSLLSGVTTSLFVVSWMMAARSGAYMMVDVFLTVGVIIPMVMMRILFNEEIRVNQWLGFALLVVATAIMCSYNNKIKNRITPVALLLLVAAGAFSGACDFAQKLFNQLFVTESSSSSLPAVFNLYSYLFSAAVLAIFFVGLSLKSKRSLSRIRAQSRELLSHTYLYIPIMAICLFGHSYFKTLAGGYLTTAELYPLNSGVSLILTSVMSHFFFGERITPRCTLGLLVTFTGLIVANYHIIF